MDLEVTSELIATLVAEAALAGGVECCGLLLGRGARVEEVRPTLNVANDPARNFEIDPAALIVAHRSARVGGAQILGYYHSHPRGLPVPSDTDRRHASGDGRAWAIIARGEVRFWRDDGTFSPLSYQLFEG